MEAGDRAKGIVPGKEVASAVRKLIAADDEATASSRFLMNPQTIARLGAGLPVNRASMELGHVRLGVGEDLDG